jgi:hypothetical protein
MLKKSAFIVYCLLLLQSAAAAQQPVKQQVVARGETTDAETTDKMSAPTGTQEKLTT